MAKGRRVLGLAIAAALVLAAFSGGWLAGRLGIGPAVPRGSLTDLEREFAQRMDRSTLVGYFTVDGREDRPLRPDRYDLAGVEKIGENLWRFNTRMRHDDVDMTVPIAVPLQWVGDTPMIVMTDTSVPGLGTFTCRVFFYGNRYAGTWQNGPVGGHLFGRIEKQAAADR